MLLRRLPGILLGLVLVAGLRADERAREIARIHTEALGGYARIAALSALRISGRAETGGSPVRFTLLAARPNRLRLETHFADRVVLQGTDGVSPPWQIDLTRGAPMTMDGATAALFLADADFDDPLVRAESEKLTIEFGGEVELDGRRMLRVLVARLLTENVFLLLDAETYLIAARRQTHRAGGQAIETLTRYDDYRPVAGVLVAHEITFFMNGALAQRARFTGIHAEPAPPASAFAPPGK